MSKSEKEEGQLKRRIRDYPQIWLHLDDETKKVLESSIGDIIDILDEAKTEILEWRKRQPQFAAERKEPCYYNETDKFYYARDVWLEEGMKIFEKWFGSEEVKK